MNTKVSTFTNLSKPGKSVTLDQVFQVVKGNTLRERVESMRQLLAKGAHNEFEKRKRSLPSFTPAGEFDKERKADRLKSYSRLVVYDLDDIPVEKLPDIRQKVAADPHTLLAFISPSGTGLKILVAVTSDSKDHGLAFSRVCEHYDRITGLTGDRTGKDLSRLCFYSFDPEAYYNPHSEAMDIQVPTDAVVKLLRSDFHDAYSKAKSNVSKQKTFKEGSRNTFVHQLACECNRLGIPAEVTLELIIASELNFNEDEIRSSVKSAYNNHEEFGLKNQEVSRLLKIMEYLAENYELRRNEVLNRVEYKRIDDGKEGLYDEIFENSLVIEMKMHHVAVTKDLLRTVIYSDRITTYHPFKNYLSNLLPWDQSTDHIKELCSTLGTPDQAYAEEMLKKFLVAIVASHLQETANHVVIVLQGPQGLGKTTFNRKLNPDCLKNYFYSGDLDPHDKDSEINLSECWLIDLDDIGSKSKRGLDELKSLVTKESIRQRRPYGAYHERMPRRASMIASSNNERFLTDLTGNRRFVTIELSAIDLIRLKSIDIDKVYSQALALYKSGFKYWLDAKEIDSVNTRNEKYRITSLIEDYIAEDFEPGDPNGSYKLITAAGMAKYLMARYKLPARDDLPEKIGKIMTGLDFKHAKPGGRKSYMVKHKHMIVDLDPAIADLFGNGPAEVGRAGKSDKVSEAIQV